MTQDFSDLCFLHPFHLPAQHAHSIQILQTCRALAQAGARVCLLVKRNPQQPFRDPSEAVAACGMTSHPNWTVRFLPTNHNGVAGLAARWHVRHAHRAPVFYARHLRLAASAARAARGPVLVELHGIEGDTPRAVAAADGIATITTALQECVRERFRPRVPMRVIPDGFDDGIFVRAGNAGPVRLVYMGQFYEWKGVDVLIRALARLPDLSALIIGGSEASDPRRLELQARAVREGVANRIEWPGYLPPRAIPARLRSSDIAILPTRAVHGEEISASPLKLFEYMACGLPVVASDLPSIRDVIRDGENGLLFRDGDPDSLAAAVRRLLSSAPERERIADNAWRQAADYTWNARALRILSFIDEVAAARAHLRAGVEAEAIAPRGPAE